MAHDSESVTVPAAVVRFTDPLGMDVLGVEVHTDSEEKAAEPLSRWLRPDEAIVAVRSGRELGQEPLEGGGCLADLPSGEENLRWWPHQAYTFFEATRVRIAWNKAMLLSSALRRLIEDRRLQRLVIEGAGPDATAIAEDLGRRLMVSVELRAPRRPPLRFALLERLGERAKLALRVLNRLAAGPLRPCPEGLDVLFLANGAHSLRWKGKVGFHVFAPLQEALDAQGVRHRTIFIQNRIHRPRFLRKASDQGYFPFEAGLSRVQVLKWLARVITPRVERAAPHAPAPYQAMGLDRYFRRKFRPFAAWRRWETGQNMQAYLRILDALRPRLVVLSDEANSHGLTMIAACRKHGIPTMAIQHGIIHPCHFGYVHCTAEIQGGHPPLIPDETLVFGGYFKEVLQAHGRYPEASVRIVGNARYDDLLIEPGPDELVAFRKELRLPGQGPLVLFMTQPFPNLADRETYLHAVCRGMRQVPGATLVLKPHPMEHDLRRHHEVPAELGLEFRVTPGADFTRLFRCVDLAVAANSTTLIEALMAGCPAMSMNFSGLTENLPFAASGACLEASSPEEVPALLSRLLVRGKRDPGFLEARDRFLAEMVGPLDGGATERSVEAILARLGPRLT